MSVYRKLNSINRARAHGKADTEMLRESLKTTYRDTSTNNKEARVQQVHKSQTKVLLLNVNIGAYVIVGERERRSDIF